MSELAKRILERIKQDTRGTDILEHLSGLAFERWEKIIDEEVARMIEEEADEMGWKPL